jgi:molybdopterin synthase sulfur carrier subunit
VKLLYFARVRQKIGKSEETLALPAGVCTVRELAQHLRTRGPGYVEAFADPACLHAAVNLEHVGFDTPLGDGDEIAFFPPVTGG